MAYKRKRTCDNCVYWRVLSAAGYKGPGKACHYLLWTGQRRKIAKTGRCLSWTGTGGTHNKQVFRLYRPAENKVGGDFCDG